MREHPTDPQHVQHVNVRLEGKPHEVRGLLAWLRAQDALSLVSESNPYGNRTGADVRVYLTIRLTDLLPFAEEED
ncbi:hypothetical protein FBQ95_16965 [Chloroflexi bacterium CFX3]|nr:hypothetical protein [Chloroflexi bacterium CFX3]